MLGLEGKQQYDANSLLHHAEPLHSGHMILKGGCMHSLRIFVQALYLISFHQSVFNILDCYCVCVLHWHV
jgi:hypothetical protein